MPVKLSRRARWGVPAAGVAVTAAVIAGLQIPSAQASPDLPARTPAQLLAEVSTDASLPPLTGTMVESTSLGLPQLPQIGGATSLSSLLTGSHTLKIYYQDARQFRVSLPEPESEVDLIRNGATAWLWNSTQNSVTKFTLPANSADKATGKAAHLKGDLGTPPLTPQQVADEVLKAVGKTTIVSVEANVMVAGEPCYQLVLAPRDDRSLVGQVTIAVDGKYGVPLRVQVFAKHTTSPAFQFGYTALQFVAPASANYDFTPPAGASLSVVNASGGSGTSAGGKESAPSGFGSYGKSWLTVVELPQQDLMQGIGAGGLKSSSSAAPTGTSGPSSAMSEDSQAVISNLIGAAKPVHGSWGSGTLLTTSLFSMLMTNGEVYIGAVEPSVLYAAVGHTSS
jgi:outer membrane lipoprotein-sorting protein